MSRSGHDFLQVHIDLLTGRVWLVPTVKTATADVAARNFVGSVFRDVWLPDVLVTDRDTRFNNMIALMKNTSKADNLRRGLDTAPTQGPASAGANVYTITNTYTLKSLIYAYTLTGQFSLTSISSHTNKTIFFLICFSIPPFTVNFHSS